jgi:hypothetical protein
MPQGPVLAALAAVVTVVFLIAAKSSGRDRFAFLQESRAITKETRVDGEYVVVTITGIIQNKSSEANSLVELVLVRWRNNRRGTILFERGPCALTEGAGEITLPQRFESRLDRRVTLTWAVRTESITCAENLEIALEDSNSNLYDQRGMLKNAKNIARRQELGRRAANIQDGKLVSFLGLYLRIKLCDLGFLIKRILRRIGL